MLIFLYCDEELKAPTSGYDIVMRVAPAESFWEQLEELFAEATKPSAETEKEDSSAKREASKDSKSEKKLAFYLSGALGFNAVARIEELAKRGAVTWEVAPEVVEPYRKRFAALPNVRIVEEK